MGTRRFRNRLALIISVVTAFAALTYTAHADSTNPLVDLYPQIDGPTFAVDGQPFTYTITVNNAGSMPSAGIITVTASGPTATGPGWDCSAECTTNASVPPGGSLPPISVHLSAPTVGQLFEYASIDGGS